MITAFGTKEGSSYEPVFAVTGAVAKTVDTNRSGCHELRGRAHARRSWRNMWAKDQKKKPTDAIQATSLGPERGGESIL